MGPLHNESDTNPTIQVGGDGFVRVQDMSQSFQTLGVSMQNTKVFIEGDITFKSDKPLECLTLKYSKEDPAETKYSYFSCKTCNVNWVCEWCKAGCHAGHEVLTHLLDHRPTYACCYCVKKGLCKIANNKNTCKK